MVGHDWGAPVAWHTALWRPDRVRGVVGLSVPFRPRGQLPPISRMRTAFGEGFYMVYFQQTGVADAELNADPRRTLRTLLYSLSGDAPDQRPFVVALLDTVKQIESQLMQRNYEGFLK